MLIGGGSILFKGLYSAWTGAKKRLVVLDLRIHQISPPHGGLHLQPLGNSSVGVVEPGALGIGSTMGGKDSVAVGSRREISGGPDSDGADSVPRAYIFASSLVEKSRHFFGGITFVFYA